MPSLIYSLRSSAASVAPSLRAALCRMRRELVKRELEGSQMVAGLWYHSLTVRQIQYLRRALPKSAKLIVAKNTLLSKSAQGTSWEPLRSCASGINAWLFVQSDDDVAAALKAYRAFQCQWKLDLNDFTGAVFQGQLYGPQDLGVLKTTSTTAGSNEHMLGSLHLPDASLLGLLQTSLESVSASSSPPCRAEPCCQVIQIPCGFGYLHLSLLIDWLLLGRQYWLVHSLREIFKR